MNWKGEKTVFFHEIRWILRIYLVLSIHTLICIIDTKYLKYESALFDEFMIN